MKFGNTLCSPALLYVIMSVLSLLIAIAHKMQFATIIIKAIFIAAWTWFLNYLCKLGHKDVAWFLVLLPFLIMLGMFVIAVEAIARR